MGQNYQVRGKVIPYIGTKSFIEKSLLPENLPIGRVIDPIQFIEKQKYTGITFSAGRVNK